MLLLVYRQIYREQQVSAPEPIAQLQQVAIITSSEFHFYLEPVKEQEKKQKK